MHSFPLSDLFIFCTTECKQQLRTMK